jgi:L-lactate dehydrogenase (cytochrome)
MAVQCGVDGIIVSNHGGRQLDSAMASLAALPAIRDVVPGDFVVMLDGGVRRGTDVLKAVAPGADMVFVGRPALYGASVAGERGAGKVLDILHAEVDRNLALLGCAQITNLDTGFLDPVRLTRITGKHLESSIGGAVSPSPFT